MEIEVLSPPRSEDIWKGWMDWLRLLKMQRAFILTKTFEPVIPSNIRSMRDFRQDFFFLYPPLSYFLSRSLVLWCYFPPLRFSSSLLQDFSPLLAPPAVYKIQSQFSNQKTHCLPIGLRCNLKLHSWIPPPVSSLYSVPSIQIFYISRDITRPYFS